jgi:hypothetical protein
VTLHGVIIWHMCIYVSTALLVPALTIPFYLWRPIGGPCHFLCFLWVAESRLISLTIDGDPGTAVRWISCNSAQLAYLEASLPSSHRCCWASHFCCRLRISTQPPCLPSREGHSQHPQGYFHLPGRDRCPCQELHFYRCSVGTNGYGQDLQAPGL